MLYNAIEVCFIVVSILSFIWLMKKKGTGAMLIIAFSIVVVAGCRYQDNADTEQALEHPKYTKSNCGCL